MKHNFLGSRSDFVALATQLSPGDILSADWERDGIIDHQMVVTRKDSLDIYLTYHSTDNVDKPLSELPDADYMGWRITGTTFFRP